MQLDQLNGLLALKAIAEVQNFTAAARLFGVSPSAISQTIKQLEQRVGVALLSRTTRSTSLTEAGERFLGQAGPALDQILAALEEAGSYTRKSLRACSGSICRGRFTGFIWLPSSRAL